MKALYNFSWDCRYGVVESLFIATESEVKGLIGKEVYFGEVLGKHSEVYGEIEEGEIEKVDVSESTLKELEKTFGKTIMGYNPLEYVSD